MKKEDYLQKIRTELKLRDYSKRTLESYLHFINPFLGKCSNPEKVSLDKVKDYLADLADKYNNRSRALAVSSLRFFFKRIVDRPEIFVKLEVPKKQKTLPVVLSKQEIKLLINATKIQKTKLIIKFLYASGLRVSELVKLKPKDLDFEQNIGWVRKGKGNKDRIFKLAEALKNDLKKYINENPEREYLFSKSKPLSTRNVQLLISKAAQKININKKITPHTLRHSFATHLYEAGEDLLAIQSLLGHENLETTKIYTKVSQQRIQKVKSPLDSL